MAGVFKVLKREMMSIFPERVGIASALTGKRRVGSLTVFMR